MFASSNTTVATEVREEVDSDGEGDRSGEICCSVIKSSSGTREEMDGSDQRTSFLLVKIFDKDYDQVEHLP